MKPTPMRLLVPLAWASFGIAQPATQQPAMAHVWQQSQATDVAGSLTFTRFTLVGKFLDAPNDPGSNHPALALDCIPGTGPHPSKRRFLAGNLLVGTTLKIDYVEPEEIHGMSYYPKVVVRYRTDDADGEKQDNWSPGADKTSVSIPKDTLKKILRARTIAITADDEHGTEVAMEFNMPDSTLVEQSCNVDEHKE